jgi:Flp pilus assembly protein TadD
MAAESGDFESALADFHRALRLASKGWEHRARTRRDVGAIEVYLEQGAGS